nr:proline-rich extensin-like protein EPR1 [Penaeus vannamei]
MMAKITWNDCQEIKVLSGTQLYVQKSCGHRCPDRGAIADSVPRYSPPTPSYSPPTPVYSPPNNPPTPAYNPPQPAYNPPAPAYNAPAPSLPDGRLQTVTYNVNGDSGFLADVAYQGEAQYPAQEPSRSYQPAPSPSYQPAPSPSYQPAPTPAYG